MSAIFSSTNLQRPVPRLHLTLAVTHRAGSGESGVAHDLSSTAAAAAGPARSRKLALPATRPCRLCRLLGGDVRGLLIGLHSLLALEPLVLSRLGRVRFRLLRLGQQTIHLSLGQLRSRWRGNILEDDWLALRWDLDRLIGTGSGGRLLSCGFLACLARFEIRDERI